MLVWSSLSFLQVSTSQHLAISALLTFWWWYGNAVTDLSKLRPKVRILFLQFSGSLVRYSSYLLACVVCRPKIVNVALKMIDVVLGPLSNRALCFSIVCSFTL